MARARWGEIVHPTIEDFVLMILHFVGSRPGLTMADVDLWKTDLKGAYTLMSFKPTYWRRNWRYNDNILMRTIWMVFNACSFPGDNESDNLRARINPARDGANVC